MATEIKHIKIDEDTRIGPLLSAAGSSPVIVEIGDTAYRINPLGATSSPFTVESAYASIRTVDGRSGANVSDDDLEAMIDEAKGHFAQRLLESGITHLLISLHGATAAVHDAATDTPGSFEQTISGIDSVMALRPAHVDTGLNVTIIRGNVDHLMPLTELAIAKGFSKINFQFMTPFGRAYEDVVPPLDAAARAVMEVIDHCAQRIQILVINAQFCAFPGYEQYVVGDLQKLGRTMVFAADPRFPEQVNLYQWLGAKREKREVCTECPWTTACEGFQVFAQEKPDMRVERARPVIAA